jgi:thiamine phosphate synthase YjbQ (UPF0047 family)
VREVSHPSERRLQHGGADAGDVHAHARCVCVQTSQGVSVMT